MHKNSFILLILSFFIGHLSASLSPEHIALAQFAELGKRCTASLRTTNDKRAFQGFSDIARLYRAHRITLQNLATLSDEQVRELNEECSLALEQHCLIRRSALGVVPHEHPDHALMLSLEEAISNFLSEYEHQLIKETTPQRWLERIIAQTVIETAAMAADYGIELEDKDKKLCAVSQRLAAMSKFNREHRNHLLQSIGISSARITGNLLVDEWLPRGRSTYLQRLIELVAPVLAAGIIMSGVTGKFGKFFLKKALSEKAFTRFVMTRGLFDRRTKAYQALNIAAYTLPFTLISSTFKKHRNNLGDDHVLANIAYDGLSSMLTYDILPLAIDKALPRAMPLNPSHRRKAAKNIPRDALWRLIQEANKAAGEIAAG